MVYKLYYDTIPGNKLLYSRLDSTVEEYGCHLWDRVGYIHSIMSVLGINYVWTTDANDPDAIIIIEVDSQPDDVFFKIIKIASRKYKKSIVVSTTEQPSVNIVNKFAKLFKIYPNVLLSFCGYPELNDVDSKLIFYPYYLLKPFTFETPVSPANAVNCNNLTKRKTKVFNHLSKNWSKEKYHTHYTIKRYFDPGRKAMLSYQPINMLSSESRKENATKHLRDWISENNELRMVEDSSGMYKKLYPTEDYISGADPDSKDHFPSETIKGDPLYSRNDYTHEIGMKKLVHPKEIYQSSYISLITEIEEGQWISPYLEKCLKIDRSDPPSLNTKEDNMRPPELIFNHFISEKTVQPILNNHIFIVCNADLANGSYNTLFLKNYLGFELFEEIFDYQDIESGSRYLATYKIVNQLNKFDDSMVLDNAKILAEKIIYNKDLLLNPSSSLRRKLKKWFVEDVLEKFLKFEP